MWNPFKRKPKTLFKKGKRYFISFAVMTNTKDPGFGNMELTFGGDGGSAQASASIRENLARNMEPEAVAQITAIIILAIHEI